MYTVLKFKDNKFVGVMGCFASLEQIKDGISITHKPAPNPKDFKGPGMSAEEAAIKAAKVKGKTTLEQMGVTVKVYDTPPDDFFSITDDCPEVKLDD